MLQVCVRWMPQRGRHRTKRKQKSTFIVLVFTSASLSRLSSAHKRMYPSKNKERHCKTVLSASGYSSRRDGDSHRHIKISKLHSAVLMCFFFSFYLAIRTTCAEAESTSAYLSLLRTCLLSPALLCQHASQMPGSRYFYDVYDFACGLFQWYPFNRRAISRLLSQRGKMPERK